MGTYYRKTTLCILYFLCFNCFTQNINWDEKNNVIELSTRINTLFNLKNSLLQQSARSYYSLSMVNRTSKTINYRLMITYDKSKYQDGTVYLFGQDTLIQLGKNHQFVDYQIRPGIELSKSKKNIITYLGIDASFKCRNINYFNSSARTGTDLHDHDWNTIKRTGFLFGLIGFYGWKWNISDRIGVKYNFEYGIHQHFGDDLVGAISLSGGHFLSLAYKL